MLMVNEKTQADVIKCLEQCIEIGTGGDIREVTAEEYADWQKKTTKVPQQKLERDAYSGGPVRDTVASKSTSPAPAAATPAAVTTEAPVETAPPPQQPPQEPQQPLNIPTRRRGVASAT